MLNFSNIQINTPTEIYNDFMLALLVFLIIILGLSFLFWYLSRAKVFVGILLISCFGILCILPIPSQTEREVLVQLNNPPEKLVKTLDRENKIIKQDNTYYYVKKFSGRDVEVVNDKEKLIKEIEGNFNEDCKNCEV